MPGDMQADGVNDKTAERSAGEQPRPEADPSTSNSPRDDALARDDTDGAAASKTSSGAGTSAGTSGAGIPDGAGPSTASSASTSAGGAGDNAGDNAGDGAGDSADDRADCGSPSGGPSSPSEAPPGGPSGSGGPSSPPVEPLHPIVDTIFLHVDKFLRWLSNEGRSPAYYNEVTMAMNDPFDTAAKGQGISQHVANGPLAPRMCEGTRSVVHGDH